MVATAKDCVRQGARRRGWAITCDDDVTRRRATSTAATATPSTASGRWLRRRCDARGAPRLVAWRRRVRRWVQRHSVQLDGERLQLRP